MLLSTPSWCVSLIAHPLRALSLLLLLASSAAAALEATIRSTDSVTCAAIFAPGFLVPSVRPAKMTVGAKALAGTPFGYILYDYEDQNSIGHTLGGTEKTYFCTEELVGKGPCTGDKIGQLLVDEKKPPPRAPVVHGWNSGKGHAESTVKDAYPVTRTGYYCLRIVNPKAGSILLSVDAENPYGKLPPELYPLFKVVTVLMTIYAAGLITWACLTYQHQKHVVTLQNYIGTVIALLLLEMATNYAFYHGYNQSGSPSTFVMGLLAVCSALRSTASLFFLLLVSIGYGVVRPSLGDDANSITILTAVHLVFSIVNALADLSSGGQSSTAIFLLSIPVSVTFNVFFSRIFASLAATKQSLASRKQNAKLHMYQRLTWIIYSFFAAACFFMLAAIFTVLGYSKSQEWYAQHWNWLWFLSNGWPILLNFSATTAVAIIFRPQAYNRSYGLQELSDYPLDEESLESHANVALDTLRTSADFSEAGYRRVQPDLPRGDLSTLGSRNRWATENLGVFGDDDNGNYNDNENDNDKDDAQRERGESTSSGSGSSAAGQAAIDVENRH